MVEQGRRCLWREVRFGAAMGSQTWSRQAGPRMADTYGPPRIEHRTDIGPMLIGVPIASGNADGRRGHVATKRDSGPWPALKFTAIRDALRDNPPGVQPRRRRRGAGQAGWERCWGRRRSPPEQPRRRAGGGRPAGAAHQAARRSWHGDPVPARRRVPHRLAGVLSRFRFASRGGNRRDRDRRRLPPRARGPVPRRGR